MKNCFEGQVLEVKLTQNGWIVVVKDRDEEIIDAKIYNMYGYWSIPPIGSRVLCFQLTPTLLIAINPDNFNYRPDILQNEVVTGDFVDNVYIKYTKNSIDINSAGIKNINIKSTDTNIQSKVTIIGNVELTGNFKQTGDIDLTGGFKNTGLTELGTGGQPIARLGDTVQVIVAGTPWNGTITSGGNNKSV